VADAFLQSVELLAPSEGPPRTGIYHCGERGLQPVEYEDAEPVRLTRSFLEARDRFVHELMRE
jgi:predicted ATPase